MAELKASLDTIRTAAHDLITAIDAELSKDEKSPSASA